jgi:hypothetical protein
MSVADRSKFGFIFIIALFMSLFADSFAGGDLAILFIFETQCEAVLRLRSGV